MNDSENIVVLCNLDYGNDKILDTATDIFLAKLGSTISLKSELCYHYERIDNALLIPIETNYKEIKLNKSTLIEKKLNQIIKLLENIDFLGWGVKEKYALNLLQLLSGQTSFLRVMYEEFHHDITFNLQKFPDTTAYETKLSDGSIIKQIVSPFIDDWGIYIDHSKKFSDFTLDYNCLHLFEHLAVPWEENEHYIFTNGFTNIVGICICALITDSKSSCIKGTNEYLSWHKKFRSNFDSFKSKIEREVVRTNYETIDGSSITAFGKNFTGIYSKDYKYDILKYYASQPFTIMLVVPEFIKWNNFIDLPACKSIKKPEPTTLTQIPYTYFTEKEENKYTILPSNLKQYFDKLELKKIEDQRKKEKLDVAYPQKYIGNYLEGVDCILVPMFEEKVKSANTLLRQLFVTPTKDIPKFLHANPLPYKNYGLYMLDRNLENKGAYLVHFEN
jgi:hypothetical protein